MRAGRLRHRVKIRQNDGKADRLAAAGDVPDWTTIEPVQARVESTTGQERIEGGQQRGDATHIVTMRHRMDVTEQHQLLWESQTLGNVLLNIEAVIPAERPTEIVLLCKRVA